MKFSSSLYTLLCAGLFSAASLHASDVNIAVGKPVTTNLPTFGGYPATNVTDGDATTFSEPESIPAVGFYFQVDLGQEVALQSIELYSRINCCPDRLSNVRMSVYADNGGVPGTENWFLEIRPDGSNHFQGGVDILTASMQPAGLFRGRFLRITNTGNQSYAPEVAEIQAFEAPRPSIRSFLPDQGNITHTGNAALPTSATLSWDVAGATAWSIDHGVGSLSGATGSLVVSPAVTTTYTLTATNGAGVTTQAVTIGVDEVALPPSISEFMASNLASLADAAGGHPDWIELANPNAFTLNLKDFYLTDNPGE